MTTKRWRLKVSLTMNEILEQTVPVIVRFADPGSAETARSTIETMLRSANEEVEALFESGGGIAQSNEVEKIYAKFGFRNDSGWSQQRPIVASGSEIKWDVPMGVELEDVQLLLLSLGAQAISLHSEDEEEELYFRNLHPLALPQDEDDDDMPIESVDEEFHPPIELKKKLLH